MNRNMRRMMTMKRCVAVWAVVAVWCGLAADAASAATLAERVAAAPAGSVLTLPADTAFSGETVTVDKNLTIQGSAGSAFDRVTLNIAEGCTVTLNDVAVGRTGSFFSDSRGIRNYGTLTVNRCTFTDSAGIWTEGPQLTVNACRFSGGFGIWEGEVYLSFLLGANADFNATRRVEVNDSTFAGLCDSFIMTAGELRVQNSAFYSVVKLIGFSPVLSGGRLFMENSHVEQTSGTFNDLYCGFIGNAGDGAIYINNSTLWFQIHTSGTENVPVFGSSARAHLLNSFVYGNNTGVDFRGNDASLVLGGPAGDINVVNCILVFPEYENWGKIHPYSLTDYYNRTFSSEASAAFAAFGTIFYRESYAPTYSAVFTGLSLENGGVTIPENE